MELRTETIEPIRVAYLRGFGPYSKSFPVIWPQLNAYAARHGLRKAGALFLSIAHNNPRTTPGDQIVGDACVSVPDDFKVVREPGDPDVQIQVIPAGRYAVAKYVGPFQGLPAAWAEFCDRMIPASGYRSRKEFPFEIYRTDPATTPPDQTVTDLHFPIEGE